MIRVFIAYKSRDAVLFFVNNMTIEDVRNRFLGSYPVVFQTTEGQVTVDWDDVKKVYIQEWARNKPIGKVTEMNLSLVRHSEYAHPKMFQAEEPKMADEEVVQTDHFPRMTFWNAKFLTLVKFSVSE